MRRLWIVLAVGMFGCASEDPPTRYPGFQIDGGSQGDAAGDPLPGDGLSGDELAGDGTCDACVVPWGCSVGETCDVLAGCCVAAPYCTPETCADPQFCHDNDCLTAANVCLQAASGCECFVVGDSGIDPTGTPTITLSTGAQRDIEVVLAVVDGEAIPSPTFDLSVVSGSPAPFTVTGSSVTASGTAGGATLTATVGSLASCDATLVNLGPQPPSGTARFVVQDSASGAALNGAQVIVDSDGDGTDDGGAAPTDFAGQTTATVSPSGSYAVTVVRAGYQPLTVVGLSARDVLLPLSARPAPPLTGGFDGKIDFTPYEDQILGGYRKTIRLAFVTAATDLTRFIRFDDSLVWGPTESVDCGQATPPPGCYEIAIPGLIDPPIWTAMPGGWIMSLASNAVKSHFELPAEPGLRYASALAAEVEVSDFAGAINRMIDGFECDCDGTAGVCDVACDCDPDCGGFVVLRMLADYVPLFGHFASGVRGNLQLGAAPVTDWDAHRAEPYIDRISTTFPRLDDGEDGRIAPVVQLSVFSDLAVPNLPPDPAAGDGRGLDGLVVVTGVVTPSGDLVPLGVSAAVDCTTAQCNDREGAGAADFDNVVNGALACYYDPDPELNGCPPGVPVAELNDGHVALFHAPAHSGLEGLPWVTMVVALPEFGTELRTAGYVVREQPTSGASNQLASGSFPVHPALPAQIVGRSYTAAAASGVGGHWVTFTDGTTRWQVFFAGASGTFVAPSVVGDPFSGGTVDVEHVALRLTSGATLEGLARNDGTTLRQVGELIDGFAARYVTLPIP